MREGHCLPTHECIPRLTSAVLRPGLVLCAHVAQTQLLPFGSNPQDVHARERGGSFGRGCAALVPGPSSPPQACDGLCVEQAHRNQRKDRPEKASMEAKTYIYVGSTGTGGSRSVQRDCGDIRSCKLE